MASTLTGQFLLSALNKQIDWDDDDIRVALVSSVPASTTDFFDDVAGSEVSGTGYTAGGEALSGKAMTYDAGTKTLVLTADDVVWGNSTINARAAVIYDATPGSAATQPVIGVVDFGTEQSSNNGNFTITWDASGIVRLSVA